MTVLKSLFLNTVECQLYYTLIDNNSSNFRNETTFICIYVNHCEMVMIVMTSIVQH